MSTIAAEPQSTLCRYLKHINILEVYEQLEEYNPYESGSGLANIQDQFCDTLARCFEDLASVASALLAEPWETMKPIEIAAVVGDLIEHSIELLYNGSGEDLPETGDSIRETLDSLYGLILTESYISAGIWELNSLVVYQYDFLCWLYANNHIAEAFEVCELISGTRGQIQHIEALGLQEHRGAVKATQRAQELAKKRHAPTNKLKDELLEEWATTGNQYESRADFCRIVGRRSGVLERTLSVWIARHEKSDT